MADFITVAAKNKAQNEHQKAEVFVRLQQELKKLFDQAWIVNPVGDVSYTLSVTADDNKDTYLEQAAGYVADTAVSIKDAVVGGKAGTKSTVNVAKKK